MKKNMAQKQHKNSPLRMKSNMAALKTNFSVFHVFHNFYAQTHRCTKTAGT